jgi:YVTN family beta-propeller protein
MVNEFSLNAAPTGLVLSQNGEWLYVTAGFEKGQVYLINLKNKKIDSQISVGHSPNSPICSKDGKILYVNNQFDNDISVIKIASKETVKRVKVLREPSAAAITPNGKYLFVANLLPVGPADQYSISSAISVIDLSNNSVLKNIDLPNGSNAVKGITVSSDGKYVYATHILARYQMPTTQLERGWMNTNALSILSVNEMSLHNTILLDEIDLGAANPWDVKCSEDGKYVCVSHAGSHEISIIDRRALHSKLDKVGEGLDVAGRKLLPKDVKNDLAFLDGLRRRVTVSGLGPRGITISNNKLYAAEYFSASIGIVDIEDFQSSKVKSISLGKAKTMSGIRKGELLFHDARQCFQQWQSCSSCHPGEARSDALNWDLLNDGVGNSKNSKSLLLSHQTPPVMSTGVRDKAESAVRAGIKYIQFAELPDEEANKLDLYLNSLKPLISPHLIDGKLSKSAIRGKDIFDSAKCAECHSGPLFTNLQKYNVGTGKGREEDIEFDTPTIIENWRTAPFLHDGRAATLNEIFTKYNPADKHGITSTLSDKEIDDLVEYVLSQ